MAATQEKATPCCHADESHVVGAKGGAVSRPVRREWASEPDREKRAAAPPIEAVASLIAPVEDIQETPSVPTSSKGDPFFSLGNFPLVIWALLVVWTVTLRMLRRERAP